MAKHSLRFVVYNFVHNCIAHPLLPFADLLSGTRFDGTAREIYKFHENTAQKIVHAEQD